MKRNVRAIWGIAATAAVVIGGLVIVAGSAAAPSSAALGCTIGTEPCDPFVRRVGTELFLEGQPYQFTGFNIYNANNGGLCWYAMKNSPMLAESLDAIGSREVVRAWFFQSLATSGGQRDWSGFDQTLQLAAARNIKVIPVLINQWADCDGPDGGAGIEKDQTWYESGYSSSVLPGGIVTYRSWVNEVVSRYAGDPTVLAWQLVNEAEVKTSAGECLPNAVDVLRDFAADVSNVVKQVDANHLISLGTIGSGQCGAAGDDYATVHAVSTLDLCEFHDYGYPTEVMPGDQWNGLQVRLDQCRALGRPLFIGESGIRPTEVGGTLQQRADAFANKRDGQFAAGVVGLIAWAWNANWSTLNDFDVGPRDPLLATFGHPPAPRPEFTLRVTKAGSGGGSVVRLSGGPGCAGDCVADIEADSSVTLTPYPYGGSRFVAWSGPDAGACGSTTCVLTMDSARWVTATFAVGQGASQTITYTSSPPPNPVVGGTYTVTATGGASGNPVVFSIDASATSVCSMSGTATVSFNAAGTCVIDANQAGDLNYAAASQAQQSFAVGQVSQTITFGALPNRTMVQSPFTVSATASSGLAVRFTTTTPSVCSSGGANGRTITLIAAGTCTVKADQAGNVTYSPAPSVNRSFTVSRANQVITFAALANRTMAQSPFTVSATASSGLAVRFTTTTPSVCTASGTNGRTITLIGAGSCTVKADQAGNATYAPAPSVNRSFTVSKANQTITFGAIANRTLAQSPFTVSATASSGLAVRFTTTTPAVCTASGTNGHTITLIRRGVCTVRAAQPGNATYNPAPAVSRSFRVT